MKKQEIQFTGCDVYLKLFVMDPASYQSGSYLTLKKVAVPNLSILSIFLN
jgi:uncharacterized membrane-anchored protein